MKGNILEVTLRPPVFDLTEDALAAFLVMAPELSMDGGSQVYAVCKSLGSSNPEINRILSNDYNRKVGRLHFCVDYPCEEVATRCLHVDLFRLYSIEGFARDWVGAAMQRQIKKWMSGEEDAGLEEPETKGGAAKTTPGSESTVRPRSGALRASAKVKESHGPKATRTKDDHTAKVPKSRKLASDVSTPPDGKISREALRARLTQVRENIIGGQPDLSAGRRPSRPTIGEDEVLVVSSSESEFGSALEGLTTGNALGLPLEKSKGRDPLAVAGGRFHSSGSGCRSKASNPCQAAEEDTESDQSEGDFDSGYKRWFYSRLARTTASKSRYSLSGISSATSREPAQEVDEDQAVSSDPYLTGGGSQEGQAIREEAEAQEEGEESQEGGRSSQFRSLGRLSELEFRRRLQEGLQSERLQQRGGQDGSSLDSQVSKETWLGACAFSGSRAHAVGADQQGRHQCSVKRRSNVRNQDSQLFQHRDPFRSSQCSSSAQGNEYASKFDRRTSPGSTGSLWRPSCRKVHSIAPIDPRRKLGGGTPHGTDAARGKHCSKSSNGPQRSQACQDGSQGRLSRPRLELAWIRERQRTWKRWSLARSRLVWPAKRERRKEWKRQREECMEGPRKRLRCDQQQKEGEGSRQVVNALSDQALAEAEQQDGGLTSDFGCTAADFKFSLSQCSSYKHLGCTLMWWIVRRHSEIKREPLLSEIFDDWLSISVAKSKWTRRIKGATFPIRSGDLQPLIDRFATLSLADAVSTSSLNRHAQDAWVFLCVCSLNRLAGTAAYPLQGRWTMAEAQAIASIGSAVKRRCAIDHDLGVLTEEVWQKDMQSKQVGYNGEEISTCFQLTWDQVQPSLPPKEHGGAINCIDWVGVNTRDFLLNPERLLKSPTEVELPKMPGRVHMLESDRLKIALELVSRNVCSWLPLDMVHRVKGIPVLNGLFGVRKPAVLPDGRPILRFIMNLTGTNATQYQLEGGTQSLPSITAWQSLVIDEGETLELFQSDMQNAFYLFKLPEVWQKHLAFNLVFKGETIGLTPGCKYALCCSVLPMGWLNSVSIMQEIFEHLLLKQTLSSFDQVARGKILPAWMSEIIDHSVHVGKSWWHVYLDNFCAGERVIPSSPGVTGRECHELAEEAWDSAGVVSSTKKRVSAASRITELGAEIDGETSSLGVSTEKLTRLGQATLWFLAQRLLIRKHAQILAGRWIFVLQFRRPGMSFFNETWHFISSKGPVSPKLRKAVRREFLQVLMASSTLHCNLGAQIDDKILASDASESGCAIGSAHTLTEDGADFLMATQLNEKSNHGTIPILIVSLFNGIGGAFRCYDVLGLAPQGRIAVECNAQANRICQRRWPGVHIVKDVVLVTRELIKKWAASFLSIREIHLWAGFPCTDLSSAKHGRLNLLGPNSSLFFEVPRILDLLREEFPSEVTVKFTGENVASMDEAAALEISSHLGTRPYLLDSAYAVPMRRPRFAWTSEDLHGVCPDVELHEHRYWTQVESFATYPQTVQWIEPGHVWKGEELNVKFPTAMKSIPRTQPPPKPAGIERCSEECLSRWRSDSYRYPPYQYDWRFLITTDSTWRLLSAEEKELLLGYGFGHTSLAASASQMKQNPQAYVDCRHSFLGDSFSIYSFVIVALALCKQWMPRVSYEHLAHRMGAAPGFRPHIRAQIPLSRRLSYGSMTICRTLTNLGAESLNRLLLRKTNHTGADVRVVSGEFLGAKVFPRQSVQAQWWNWKIEYKKRWKIPSHINALELEAILLSVKHQITRFHLSDKRIFHISDSYVCISIVSKGRTSSKMLQRILSQISAHLLAHGLQMIMAHVESTDNPTDKDSRSWWVSLFSLGSFPVLRNVGAGVGLISRMQPSLIKLVVGTIWLLDSCYRLFKLLVIVLIWTGGCVDGSNMHGKMVNLCWLLGMVFQLCIILSLGRNVRSLMLGSCSASGGE